MKIAGILGVDGVPIELQYLEASDLAFVEPAIEAARKWRFSAARKNGQPVRSVVQVMVEVYER